MLGGRDLFDDHLFSIADIFLPTLEGSMCDRAEFQPMLKWTHIAAALFKSAFGLIGFVTFAENTQDEISNSLANEVNIDNLHLMSFQN